ncbi:hypothetical protein BJV78DRAFT_1258519 [Lactifluus subvellereus]|nr:hypothetical protein BJV78DRAFT_1258519 [Lactifluus subvellereus]
MATPYPAFGNTASDWELFFSCLRTIILSPDSWAVFRYDENAPEDKGLCIPQPTISLNREHTYFSAQVSDSLINLQRCFMCCIVDGGRISVGLTPLSTRPRHPTISDTPAKTEHYRTRVRDRDRCCLVSGHMIVRDNYSRFKSAHIHPRAHDDEWIRRITDPAPLAALGGSTKIHSIQNVIPLRGDLHDAWDNYDFAVNPERGHTVIPFVPDFDDIAGNVLKLDHIADPNLRPLDDLFHDHFLQGVLKDMKGAGEPTWDYEDALGGGMMDLSRLDIWGGQRGQEHLEFEMAHRLYSLQVAQEPSF